MPIPGRPPLSPKNIFLYACSVFLSLKMLKDMQSGSGTYPVHVPGSKRTLGDVLIFPRQTGVGLQSLLQKFGGMKLKQPGQLLLLSGNRSAILKNPNTNLTGGLAATHVSPLFLSKSSSLIVLRDVLASESTDILMLLPDEYFVPNIPAKTLKRLADTYTLVLETVSKHFQKQKTLTVGIIDVDPDGYMTAYCQDHSGSFINYNSEAAHGSLKKHSHMSLKQLFLLMFEKYAHVFAANHKARIQTINVPKLLDTSVS